MTVLAVTFVPVTCGQCAGVYALSARYHQNAAEKGTSWNCPYCRTGWGFSSEGGENAKLRRKVERAEADRDFWSKYSSEREQERDRARHQRDGFKGAMVKAKRRVGKGVCPCCSRSFANVRRHMESKHPGYGS